ncbi:threonine/serine exporter family protein [Sporofaciens sp. SGI.106]|uniref:threonine/serine exporter family protein n=1 Tax=Sporofaciens sp. SGI.106 TaxID=3420568 RepID=UPI002A925AB7|nr:threonine/serine exporter family protein [Lachnoclostridium sp.]
MINNIFTNILCPFFGTIGFSVLFNVPKRFYLSCGITGTLGWIIYCLTVDATSPAIASFLGTLGAVLLARMLTVYMKCPITIFLISGIFPLVPGAGVYFTAYYLVTDQLALAAQQGMSAVKIAFGIVLGIVFIVAIPREVFNPAYWKQRKSRKT